MPRRGRTPDPKRLLNYPLGFPCDHPTFGARTQQPTKVALQAGFGNTQRGYLSYGGGTRAISPRESESKWGSRSALQYDGGENS